MPSPTSSSSVPAENNAQSKNRDLNEHFLDDSDEEDIGASGFNRHDEELLADDPLDGSNRQTTSFKRKQKESSGLTGSSGFSKFLSPFSRDSASLSLSTGHSPRVTPNSSNDGRSSDGSSSGGQRHERNDSKDGGPHD